MDIPILVERVPAKNCYRAKAGAPFEIEAEGSSAHDALEKVQSAIQQKLQEGAMIFHFDVQLTPSLLRGAGIWPDDEITRNWLEGIEAYRRDLDDRDLAGEFAADESAHPETNGAPARNAQTTPVHAAE